jgi:hypothetical protein
LVNVQLASGVIPGMIEKSSLREIMMNIVVDQAPIRMCKAYISGRHLAIRRGKGGGCVFRMFAAKSLN